MTNEPSDRRSLSVEILERERKIAGDVRYIDERKSKLRDIARDSGGFHEDVPGHGRVKVSAASKPKLRGVLPVVDQEIYLVMTDEEKAALPPGLVTMQADYSKGSSPSVTVTLS